jgi:hypothetical protein
MAHARNGVRWSLLVVVLASVVALAVSGGCGDCDLRVETETLPDGFVGDSYDELLRSHCGGDSWALEQGNLPPGVQLQQNGRLRGTPTRSGVFEFTVSVIDFDGVDFDRFNDIAFQGLSITID